MSDDRAWVDRLASDLAAKVDRKRFTVPHGELEMELNDGRSVYLQTRYDIYEEPGVVARVCLSDREHYYVFTMRAWKAACEDNTGALPMLIAMGIRSLLDYESEEPA